MCDPQPMRQAIYPSRVVTMLFAISLFVLIADLMIIFVAGGHPALGKLLGLVGCIGMVGSVWVNHKQTAH